MYYIMSRSLALVLVHSIFPTKNRELSLIAYSLLPLFAANRLGLSDEIGMADSACMQVNEKLTDIIRGRTIELVSKEEGLVTILFNDHSTLQIKTISGPTVNMLGEGRIEGVAEDGADLTLFGEGDRAAVLRLAAPGSSITVKAQNGQVEYSG
jgi:hypothetical protein